MFGWLAKIGIQAAFSAFGNTLVKPFLEVWAQRNNVNLRKFEQSARSTGALAAAVLQANVMFAETKAAYALQVLNWWPFRIILLALLGVSAFHFSAIMLDSTPFWIPLLMAEPHEVGSWGVPAPPSPYDDYEREFLLFFIILKPVDSAVSGALAALQSYLRRR